MKTFGGFLNIGGLWNKYKGIYLSLLMTLLFVIINQSKAYAANINLLTGKELNTIFKEINVDEATQYKRITSASSYNSLTDGQKGGLSSLEEAKKISTDDSASPAYIWVGDYSSTDTTKTIYVYTGSSSNKLVFNSNMDYMFEGITNNIIYNILKTNTIFTSIKSCKYMYKDAVLDSYALDTFPYNTTNCTDYTGIFENTVSVSNRQYNLNLTRFRNLTKEHPINHLFGNEAYESREKFTLINLPKSVIVDSDELASIMADNETHDLCWTKAKAVNPTRMSRDDLINSLDYKSNTTIMVVADVKVNVNITLKNTNEDDVNKLGIMGVGVSNYQDSFECEPKDDWTGYLECNVPIYYDTTEIEVSQKAGADGNITYSSTTSKYKVESTFNALTGVFSVPESVNCNYTVENKLKTVSIPIEFWFKNEIKSYPSYATNTAANLYRFTMHDQNGNVYTDENIRVNNEYSCAYFNVPFKCSQDDGQYTYTLEVIGDLEKYTDTGSQYVYSKLNENSWSQTVDIKSPGLEGTSPIVTYIGDKYDSNNPIRFEERAIESNFNVKIPVTLDGEQAPEGFKVSLKTNALDVSEEATEYIVDKDGYVTLNKATNKYNTDIYCYTTYNDSGEGFGSKLYNTVRINASGYDGFINSEYTCSGTIKYESFKNKTTIKPIAASNRNAGVKAYPVDITINSGVNNEELYKVKFKYEDGVYKGYYIIDGDNQTYNEGNLQLVNGYYNIHIDTIDVYNVTFKDEVILKMDKDTANNTLQLSAGSGSSYNPYVDMKSIICNDIGKASDYWLLPSFTMDGKVVLKNAYTTTVGELDSKFFKEPGVYKLQLKPKRDAYSTYRCPKELLEPFEVDLNITASNSDSEPMVAEILNKESYEEHISKFKLENKPVDVFTINASVNGVDVKDNLKFKALLSAKGVPEFEVESVYEDGQYKIKADLAFNKQYYVKIYPNDSYSNYYINGIKTDYLYTYVTKNVSNTYTESNILFGDITYSISGSGTFFNDQLHADLKLKDKTYAAIRFRVSSYATGNMDYYNLEGKAIVSLLGNDGKIYDLDGEIKTYIPTNGSLPQQLIIISMDESIESVCRNDIGRYTVQYIKFIDNDYLMDKDESSFNTFKLKIPSYALEKEVAGAYNFDYISDSEVYVLAKKYEIRIKTGESRTPKFGRMIYRLMVSTESVPNLRTKETLNGVEYAYPDASEKFLLGYRNSSNECKDYVILADVDYCDKIRFEPKNYSIKAYVDMKDLKFEYDTDDKKYIAYLDVDDESFFTTKNNRSITIKGIDDDTEVFIDDDNTDLKLVKSGSEYRLINSSGYFASNTNNGDYHNKVKIGVKSKSGNYEYSIEPNLIDIDNTYKSNDSDSWNNYFVYQRFLETDIFKITKKNISKSVEISKEVPAGTYGIYDEDKNLIVELESDDDNIITTIINVVKKISDTFIYYIKQLTIADDNYNVDEDYHQFKIVATPSELGTSLDTTVVGLDEIGFNNTRKVATPSQLDEETIEIDVDDIINETVDLDDNMSDTARTFNVLEFVYENHDEDYFKRSLKTKSAKSMYKYTFEETKNLHIDLEENEDDSDYYDLSMYTDNNTDEINFNIPDEVQNELIDAGITDVKLTKINIKFNNSSVATGSEIPKDNDDDKGNTGKSTPSELDKDTDGDNDNSKSDKSTPSELDKNTDDNTGDAGNKSDSSDNTGDKSNGSDNKSTKNNKKDKDKDTDNIPAFDGDWLDLNGNNKNAPISKAGGAKFKIWRTNLYVRNEAKSLPVHGRYGEYHVYRFDKEGKLMYGWARDPKTNNWHYFDEDGVEVYGWRYIEGKWYFFDDDMESIYRGEMFKRCTKDGYVLGDDGALIGDEIPKNAPLTEIVKVKPNSSDEVA